MKFTRTNWLGETRYTSQITGLHERHCEHIVMVQAFDDDGVRLPYFKAAYADTVTGEAKLKLSFRDAPDTGAVLNGQEKTEFYSMKSAFEAASDNAVGDLDKPFKYPASGSVQAWTNRSSKLFQTWNYRDYWGYPAGNVFNPDTPDPTPLYVNGHGHAGEGVLIRAMCYSALIDGVHIPYYVKSSNLKRSEIEVSSDGGFDEFI